MQLGISFTSFSWPDGPASTGPILRDAARRAEDAGLRSLWVMDHFFQIPPVGPAEEPMLEGYSTLAYMAAVTERIQLGTMVTGVTYRHPALLAKTVTTLDVLSGGRAWFGIGAAWFDREHVGLGVPFPPTAERFERLEEAVQIFLQMCSDDDGEFVGPHTRLAETLNSPQTLQRPHPPILIGGAGERKTLRMVAQYAQGCNLFSMLGVDEVRRRLDVLAGHCDRLGTDYGAIHKTLLAPPLPSDPAKAERYVEQMAAYAEMGIDEAIAAQGVGVPAEVLDVAGDRIVGALAEL